MNQHVCVAPIKLNDKKMCIDFLKSERLAGPVLFGKASAREEEARPGPRAPPKERY
jgi:hypothetical protein